jgi:hypothetical protein
MEVHHHPELPHGERKSLREYLLEGLMIFLAVFMGFVAENIREHLSDSGKEKNYVKSLYGDLKKDSAQLAEVIHLGEKLSLGQDSLLNLLKLSNPGQKETNDIYHLFFRYASILPDFNSTERTMSQMISSGNFRLIEKQEMADSISSYYDKVKMASLQANVNNSVALDCIQFAQNIFKFDYGLHTADANKTFIVFDAPSVEKYRNKLTQMRISQQYYIKYDLLDIQKSCIRLLGMLRHEN